MGRSWDMENAGGMGWSLDSNLSIMECNWRTVIRVVA